jgi:16S rRNA (cytosine967-C5)-methyltransferase
LRPGKSGVILPKASGKKSTNFDPVRAACVHVLHMVLDRGRKTDDALDEVLRANTFSELDRRFMLQLCHGIVKMKRRLDFTYTFYLEKPEAKIDQVTRNILRLGLFQLLFADRIPAGAAVSESVNLARGMVHHSRGSFVNAVLRSFLRRPEKVIFPDRTENPIEYLGEYYSYSDWFVKYCCDEFGVERAEKFLARGNLPPTLTYRINRLRFNQKQLMDVFSEKQIEFQQGIYIRDFYHLEKHGLPLETELIRGRAWR